MMTKSFKRFGFMAAAMVIGASTIAGTASAQDMRHYGHDNGRGVGHVEKVVVIKQPIRQPVRGGLFDRLDINNDGTVGKWEFAQRYGDSRYAMRTFRQIDLNKSGNLSYKEVAMGRGLLQDMRVRG